MLKAFSTYCKQNNLIKPNNTVLLTVSGGIDSVVMCELFHQSKLKFAIAHCNFQLRSKESVQDELFVEELSEKYNVPYHSIAFDTKNHAKKNKLSTQVAARDLRYQWFEEIRNQFNYHSIATAHHQNDSIETFFINLLRGTGIKGLHGILPIQGKIIRPLLFARKHELISFAKKYKLKHREDSSNTSDKYLRNKIRNSLIPLLNDINKNAESNILSSIHNLKFAEAIYEKEIRKQTSKFFEDKNGVIQISIAQIKKLNPIEPYLFELLYPLGFNSALVNEIISTIDAESGKQFYSETHRLIKDRNYFLVEKRNNSFKEDLEFNVLKNTKNISINKQLFCFKTMKRTSTTKLKTPTSVALLDYDKLIFPLTIRKWKKGDAFYPFGMKGKKKLSDYFIDKKLSLLEKENCWILESNGNIVWLAEQRIDERYKITEHTKKIYFVELSK